MKMFYPLRLILLTAFSLGGFVFANEEASLERPFIWIQTKDRKALIEKIHSQEWASSLADTLKARADEAVTRHLSDRDAYLKALPLEWAEGPDQPPRFFQFPEDWTGTLATVHRESLMRYLQDSIDCGVLYFLTDDETYARCAADMLAISVEALSRMERSTDTKNGGLVMPSNHLLEVRVFGAQFPIIYDFVYPYISKGGQVYDIVSGKDVAFPFEKAQKVFRTYVDMALEVGITDCNWPVLEASCLLHNILALDDPAEREALLPYVLDTETPHQDSLKKVAANYVEPGDMWPESLGYSTHVSQLSVYLMTLLDRLYPDLDLGAKYPNIAASLAGTYYLQYPNGEAPAFGDGHRRYKHPYDSYEFAHALAWMHGNAAHIDIFGSLLKTGIKSGEYNRGQLGRRSSGAAPYKTPLQLLWRQPELGGSPKEYPQNRTESLPFAGLYLQRNLTEKNPVENGLMAYVAGGHYVHGHATGMNIELYGKGVVLGVDNGKGSYTTDIHENYYRLFAGHNTVISNGASASKGGWVELGINQLELQAMEPMPREEAVSPDYSFSTTQFFDEFNLVAPAWHERTLALVRTSETTGYYVDVFRAKSDYKNQFHDYVYHNIGESIELKSTKVPLEMGKDDGRFSASANLPWEQNQAFRHPGWHWFKEVRVSDETDQPVQATFHAKHAGERGLGMRMFMNGAEGRSYATVMAPPAKLNSVEYYIKKDTPTIVARKEGDAWNQPFVAVYEPFTGSGMDASVQSVKTIQKDGVFEGLWVESTVNGKRVKQLILVHEGAQPFECTDCGIRFDGHFAIVTLDEKEEVENIYIGSGRQLQIGKLVVEPSPGETAAYYLAN